MADLDQPWVMPSAAPQATEAAPTPSAPPNIAASSPNSSPLSPSNPPNATPTPPPLPAPWSQVVAQPAIQKLNPDGRRAAFQKWSGLMLEAMGNNPQFTPELRQAVVDKIQGQYQQFDDAAKPGLLSNIGNAALGAAAIPAVAGAVVGEEAQASFTGEHPLADTAGRQAAVVAQQAKTGRVGTLLQDVGVLTGQVAPSTPTPSERQQDLDTTFNYLKQQAEAGKPITPDFVKAWGQMVHARAATANDEPPSNYTGLDRDPLAPDNAALITNYAKTLDPIYLNTLKERMTTPEAVLQAQEQQGGSLVGTLPRWAQQQIEGTLNPVTIAATVATLPLGGEGGEALQTARTFGTGADVAKAVGRELLAHGAQGGGIFAASNVAQTALNPNATPKDFGDAVLSGLVTGGIIGAGAHALSIRFGALSPVEQTAALNKLSLTPEQWGKMSDNAHEAALQEGVQLAARAGSLAGASQENAGTTRTTPPQIPPEEAAAAQQQALARMGLAGGMGNTGEVSDVLRTSGGGGPVPPVGEPVKPPSTIEPLPIPKSRAIPQYGPDRPADVIAFKKQIQALPGQDFSLDEKTKLTDLADESLDDAKEEFLKLSQQKAQYQPKPPVQGLSGVTLRGPVTISDVLGKSRLSDNAQANAPLANATLTTPKNSATPTLEAAPTPKPDKALTNNEARGENVQESKISQPQAPTTYQGSKEALEAQQPIIQAAQQQGQLPPGGQTAQTEPVNPGTIKPAKPLSQFSPLGQPVEAEKATGPLAGKTNLTSTNSAGGAAGMTNLKIGDEATLMGVPSTLADVKVDQDGVRAEIFNASGAKDPRAVVRTTDIDSGKVIGLKQYGAYDRAQKDFDKLGGERPSSANGNQRTKSNQERGNPPGGGNANVGGVQSAVGLRTGTASNKIGLSTASLGGIEGAEGSISRAGTTDSLGGVKTGEGSISRAGVTPEGFLRNALGDVSSGKGAEIKARDGGKYVITKSVQPGADFQMTYLDKNENPVWHREFTKANIRDALNAPELVEAAQWNLRPDLIEGSHLGEQGIGAPGAFLYRLKSRPVDVGTVPKEGLISSNERNVAYNRPLTEKELKDYEIQPVGAVDFHGPIPASKIDPYGLKPSGYIRQGDQYVYQPKGAEAPVAGPSLPQPKPEETQNVSVGGGQSVTGQLARLAGEEYEVVKQHSDGTYTLRNQNGDNFDTSPSEKVQILQRAARLEQRPLPATKAEFIKQQTDQVTFARKQALANAENDIRNQYKPAKPLPVGVSKVTALLAKDRLSPEERQLRAAYNVAKANVDALSDLRTVEETASKVYDNLKTKQPPTGEPSNAIPRPTEPRSMPERAYGERTFVHEGPQDVGNKAAPIKAGGQFFYKKNGMWNLSNDGHFYQRVTDPKFSSQIEDFYQQSKTGEPSNATNQIIESQRNQNQLLGVPPRPNLPENGGQVREGQSLGPNGGGSPVNGPEGAPIQPRSQGGQAASLRAEPPPQPKPIDVLTTINTSRSARISIPDEASHVQITLPSGLKKVLTADQFKKNVADGIYHGVGVRDVTPGKLVNGKFSTKGIDGDIAVKPGAGGFTLNPKDAAAAVYKYVKDKAQWATELAKRGVNLGKGALESLWNYVRGLSPRQLDIHEAQHFQDTAEGKFKEKFTDSDTRLRALVNARDVDLPPAFNPADARENLPGQRRYGTEYFKARINQVLKSVITNARDAKVPAAQYLKELNQELVATHAPERNAVHGEGAAGMTDDQAAQVKADLKNRPYYDKLQADADSVRAVNQEALQRRLDTQLISQKTFDKLNELYPNHVPLNRILPEDAMEDVDTKLGGGPGLNVMSSGMRGARGSDLPVQDVLGNVQANAIDAATRGSKNMADLQAVDFFRNNADKLNADGPAVKVITPKIVDQAKVKDSKTGKMVKEGALIYAKPKYPDRTLISRENGRPVYVEFHDKGLGQIMQGLNVAAPNGALVKAFGRIVNFMGQLQTTYSLDFKPNHFIRSAENLFFNISNETGKGTALQNVKRLVPYQMQSLKAVADWMRGADTPLARQYDAYRKGGGIMGGFDSMSREEQVNSIQKRLSELQRSKLDPRNYPAAAIKVFHALDQFSDATSRFTAYRLALDAGKSQQEANAIARRVALDFDKNGTATKELNNIFKYSKIGLQSTGQLAKVLVNPKSAALAVGTIGLVVTAQNNWNDAMDPNWRKDIPQGVQDSELPIITKPRDQDSKESPQYIPMPFAYAYTPIKVAMQEAYNMATGRQTDPADAAKHVAGSAFLKVLNPFGGTFDSQHPVESAVQTLTPTALRPIAEAGLNRAWTGKSIHPDYNGAAPSQVYFPGTKDTLGGRLAIGASGALAKAGLQVSPNTVGYVAGQYGAGPLAGIRYLGDTGAKIAHGEPLTGQDIPGSHFVASTNPNFQRTRQDLAAEQQALQEDKTAQAVRTRQAEELYDKLKAAPQAQWGATLAQAAKSGDLPLTNGQPDGTFLKELGRLYQSDQMDAQTKLLRDMDVDGRAKEILRISHTLESDPQQLNSFIQAQAKAKVLTPAVVKRLNELAAGAQ